MDLDVKKAFGSPFSSEKWGVKLIFPSIMAIFTLFSNVLAHEHQFALNLILWVIIFIPALVLSGFFAQFAHNEICGEQPLLPTLKSNVIRYLKYGFKLTVIMLIYSILFFIIGCVFGFVFGFASALVKVDKTQLPLLVSVVFIPIAVILFCYLVLAEGVFFDTFSIKESLGVKRIISLLSKVKLELLIYLILMMGFIILFVISLVILAIPKITLLLVPVLVAIMQFISVNMKAQVYKIAKDRLDSQESEA